MFMSLAGRVAVVTGAAQGIGYAIAERLAQAEAQVVIADVNTAAAETAAKNLEATGHKAIAVQTDVTKPDEVQNTFARLIETLGAIDILINNAGITGRAAPLWELGQADWQRVLSINLDGTFNCCQAVISHMRERRKGAIVNIASISGKEGNPNMIPYSVSKAGIICLTKALAKEVILDGVRVNSVAPAVVETPLLQQLTPEAVEYMRSKVPMGRFGLPQEVAAVVHFLASDDASFVTGQCYDVSGGRATY